MEIQENLHLGKITVYTVQYNTSDNDLLWLDQQKPSIT